MHAVYGKFPFVLGFVVLLTFVLLMRAFRSVFLPLKAVSSTWSRWAPPSGSSSSSSSRATGPSRSGASTRPHSIISWIPLMIFAFLYGLSMDYEVFMLTRMREAYDETGETQRVDRARAGAHRQARHERGARAHVRVLRALDRPGRRHQAVRDRARRGDHLRRDRDSRAARPGDHAARRRRWNWWLPAPVERALLVRTSPAPAHAGE